MNFLKMAKYFMIQKFSKAKYTKYRDFQKQLDFSGFSISDLEKSHPEATFAFNDKSKFSSISFFNNQKFVRSN